MAFAPTSPSYEAELAARREAHELEKQRRQSEANILSETIRRHEGAGGYLSGIADARDREILSGLDDAALREEISARHEASRADAESDVNESIIRDDERRGERAEDRSDIKSMISNMPDSDSKKEWEKLTGMSNRELSSELSKRDRNDSVQPDEHYVRALAVGDSRGVSDDWSSMQPSASATESLERAQEVARERGLGKAESVDVQRSKADADRQERQREEDARRMEQDRATLHDLPNQTGKGNNQSFTDDHTRESGLERDREMYPAGPKVEAQTGKKEENKRDAEFLRRTAPHILPAREIQRQQATEKLKTDRREPKSEFGKYISTSKSSDNNRKERSAPKSDFGRHMAAVKESSEKSETQKTQQEQEQSRGRRM